AAILYVTSKRPSGQCFRTDVLSRNHSGCRLTIAPKNRSSNEPVPKDFEIHRTKNARARTRVFRVPTPERPASRRCRNAQLIPAAGQTAESVQAVIGGLSAVLCTVGSRRHSQIRHRLHLFPPGLARAKRVCADEPIQVRQSAPVAKSA